MKKFSRFKNAFCLNEYKLIDFPKKISDALITVSKSSLE